jgi:tetratricopeptide (TPR) repeat protein
VAGYQSRRQTALKSFIKPDGANAAEHVAKLALLAPLAGAELEAAGRLADLAAAAEYADGNLRWRQFVKGLAEFRRGRFANAVEWQRKVLLANAKRALPGWTREAERNSSAAAYFVLAMAHQQSRQIEEAQSALAKGVEIVQTQVPPLATGDIGRDWPDWLIAHILLREAQALIEGQPATGQ